MRFMGLFGLVLPLAGLVAQDAPTQKLRGLPSARSLIPAAVFDAARCYAGKGLGAVEVVDSDAQPPGKAFRGTVVKKPGSPWEVGLQIRTSSKSEIGDTILVTAKARRIDSRSDPARLRFVFRSVAKPYAHSLGVEVKAGNTWTPIAIPFAARSASGAAEAVLIVHFGTQVQTAEIKDIELLSYARDVTLGRLTAALGIRSVSKGKQGIGRPLSPALLHDLRACVALPETPSAFSPGSPWTNTYAIWTCHGYRERGNRIVGMLRLQRQPGATGTSFQLEVDQQIVNDEGGLHVVQAEIECLGDARATPRKWTLTSRFVGPDGKERPGQTTEQTASTDGASLLITVGDRVFKRDGSAQLTADWCLFDAVQRLACDMDATLTFDVLEGLSLLKRGQRLQYRGRSSVTLGDLKRPMHRFSQIGHGVLPYDYWLNGRHRLQFVITHSRAYILDDDTEAKLATILQAQRGRFHRIRKREDARKAKRK